MAANYHLPTTNYQLPTTNYQLPTTIAVLDLDPVDSERFRKGGHQFVQFHCYFSLSVRIDQFWSEGFRTM